MATFLYLITHVIAPINWPYDRIVLCALIAFELPQYLRIWLWHRRSIR